MATTRSVLIVAFALAALQQTQAGRLDALFAAGSYSRSKTVRLAKPLEEGAEDELRARKGHWDPIAEASIFQLEYLTLRCHR
jgi:hypothetical protein